MDEVFACALSRVILPQNMNGEFVIEGYEVEVEEEVEGEDEDGEEEVEIGLEDE
jgi:hypothetical protein